jgi:hypothetical protein
MTYEAPPTVRADLDARLSDPRMMDARRYAEFVAAQRRVGLVHGDRPLCRHLSPYLMPRYEYEALVRAAETIMAALERVAERAWSDPGVAGELGLTEAELALGGVDPGYPQALPIGRLDGVPSAGGVQFVELNADSPAGLADQLLVERTLFALPHLRHLRAARPPVPHLGLLDSLLDVYSAWSGGRRPSTIATVDWADVETGDETRVLARLFARAGHPTLRVDPDELSFDGRELSARGERVDFVYRRVITQELLERRGLDHPLFAAYRAGAVCVANSFRAKALNKKAAFAVLSDPRFASLFSEDERAAIAQHVPWTRRVRPDTTEWRGREVDLLELIGGERERWVLKPNDDFGGRGVVLGWESSERAFRQALDEARHSPMIVQERVDPITMSAPTFDGALVEEDLYFDLCPFVFSGRVGGVMTRFSSSPLTNVSAGGCVGSLRVVEAGDV